LLLLAKTPSRAPPRTGETRHAASAFGATIYIRF
jgi:hypothetical protein